jgi:hypothetical protein
MAWMEMKSSRDGEVRMNEKLAGGREHYYSVSKSK